MANGKIVTPLGPISVTDSVTELAGQIMRLEWRAAEGDPSPLVTEALSQLGAYFDGRSRRPQATDDVKSAQGGVKEPAQQLVKSEGAAALAKPGAA